MKRIFLVLCSAGLIATTSCNTGTDKKETDTKEVASNPFFSEYNTPYNVAPFDKIKNEHCKKK